MRCARLYGRAWRVLFLLFEFTVQSLRAEHVCVCTDKCDAAAFGDSIGVRRTTHIVVAAPCPTATHEKYTHASTHILVHAHKHIHRMIYGKISAQFY